MSPSVILAFSFCHPRHPPLLSSSTLVIEDPGSFPSFVAAPSHGAIFFVIPSNAPVLSTALSFAKGLSKEGILSLKRAVVEQENSSFTECLHSVPSLCSGQAKDKRDDWNDHSCIGRSTRSHAALLSPSFVRRGVGALGMPRALTRGRGICTPAKKIFTRPARRKNKEKMVDLRTCDSYNPDKSFQDFAVSYRSTSFQLAIT